MKYVSIRLICFTVLSFIIYNNRVFAQKTKADSVHSKVAPAVNRTPNQKLELFFANIKNLVKSHSDKQIKQLLASNLQTNKAFLKEWEIGLNNADAAIWHVLSGIEKAPYAIDSTNRTKLVCKVPFIKDDKPAPNSLGILQILPPPLLDVANKHDVIVTEPDAESKPIGKVKSGERYRYFAGTTKYSASLKQYVTDAIKYDSEGEIGFYAIELDAAKHKLGYITINATYNIVPLVQLQYINGDWKIIKIDYQ